MVGGLALSGCTAAELVQEPDAAPQEGGVAPPTNRPPVGDAADAAERPDTAVDDAGQTTDPVDAAAPVDAAVPPPPRCGTAGAPLCALLEQCQTDTDCVSQVCQTSGSYAGKCVPARSCTGAPGADNACGAGHNEWCCSALPVPGGDFLRQYESGNSIDDSPAHVSAFALDTFEVTVGRLRAYFEAVGWNPRASAPAAGAGAHPNIAGSGWRQSFNSRLPGSKAEIETRLTASCIGGAVDNGGVLDYSDYGAPTWILANGPGGAANPASNPASAEDKPVGCIDWYTLAAFCAWDGGRLPSDAEWSFAAMGGNEQRAYPWTTQYVTGNTPNKTLEADVRSVTDANFLRLFGQGGRPYVISGLTLVGSGAWYPIFTFPIGSPYWDQQGPRAIAGVGVSLDRGRYGHADLGGNLIEWTMDETDTSLVGQYCDDCAAVNYKNPPSQPGLLPRQWRDPATMNADGSYKAGYNEWSERVASADGKRMARGSSWQGTYGDHWLRNSARFYGPVWRNYSAIGGRCAR